jgi:activator of HSP90 ATPase
MGKNITQTVLFKNSSPEQLYNIYMDAKKHSASIGNVPVKISNKVGAPYSAHGKYVSGKNLALVKNKMIVQSWRGSDWSNDSLDSTFILQFEKKGKDAKLIMVHANIPEKYVKGIKSGWNDFYWKPWRIYLAKLKSKKK